MFQVLGHSSNWLPSEPAAVSPECLPGTSLNSSELVISALVLNLKMNIPNECVLIGIGNDIRD